MLHFVCGVVNKLSVIYDRDFFFKILFRPIGSIYLFELWYTALNKVFKLSTRGDYALITLGRGVTGA